MTADEHARFAAWLLRRGYAPRTVEKFVRDVGYAFAAGATTADEVDAVFRERWLWSVERPNLASFRRRDFLGDRDAVDVFHPGIRIERKKPILPHLHDPVG